MTYTATRLHKNPCPGGHEIYYTGRPFLGHRYHTLSLYGVDHVPEKRKKIFFFKFQFYPFYTKITFLGHEIYNFLSPYPTNATYRIGLRLAQ